ncbi:MAG: DNA-binding protein [Sphingomonadaceae bacterium]|nr:DNA-binding protein [Sphingomonadaceae bacterium]
MQTQISVSVPEAVRLTGWSRSAIYEALKRQELAARKAGRRTLILYSDLQAFIASLPNYQGEA